MTESFKRWFDKVLWHTDNFCDDDPVFFEPLVQDHNERFWEGAYQFGWSPLEAFHDVIRRRLRQLVEQQKEKTDGPI
jgi:hypothetical protein